MVLIYIVLLSKALYSVDWHSPVHAHIHTPPAESTKQGDSQLVKSSQGEASRSGTPRHLSLPYCRDSRLFGSWGDRKWGVGIRQSWMHWSDPTTILARHPTTALPVSMAFWLFLCCCFFWCLCTFPWVKRVWFKQASQDSPQPADKDRRGSDRVSAAQLINRSHVHSRDSAWGYPGHIYIYIYN